MPGWVLFIIVLSQWGVDIEPVPGVHLEQEACEEAKADIERDAKTWDRPIYALCAPAGMF